MRVYIEVEEVIISFILLIVLWFAQRKRGGILSVQLSNFAIEFKASTLM